MFHQIITKHCLVVQILYDANDKVVGIATNDMGIAKDGSKKETFQRGVELKGQFEIEKIALSEKKMVAWDS